ncbi:succinate dehydrogenase cytochrome b subunit [Robiginitalea marina]|uniref:Succinate dehydrogenase cytochrome b subunit n=1 Tax=Robiginitalea marina TaxID=2954105 RepID=A0ABT1AYK5_9FLAO|nr:succinate dehydrogenase cytochrome b subunit [Robiginitalea marina]MCO5724288.1 succinate dehydrogenase cytochrome b subunit [Robiginitalea marina]
MSGFAKSSIARKVVMALSGLFLVLFLALHVTINMSSVISPETFNAWSHFMGYNPVVQFLMQPILIAGVVVHFVMGIVLEFQNRKARPVRYNQYRGSANAPWVSRNMILSGLVVLAFLGLHMYDFWLHEINYKFVEANPEDPTRYFEETVEKFAPLWRTVLYVISFVLLALHLWHGFASSFQSMGLNNKYSPAIRSFTRLYAIVVPLLFIFIALFHHLNPITH